MSGVGSVRVVLAVVLGATTALVACSGGTGGAAGGPTTRPAGAAGAASPTGGTGTGGTRTGGTRTGGTRTGGTETGGTETGADPCALLTRAEVERLLGQPPAGDPARERPDPGTGSASCVWTAGRAGAEDAGILQVRVTRTAWLDESLRRAGRTAGRLYRINGEAFGVVPGPDGLGRESRWVVGMGLDVLASEDLALGTGVGGSVDPGSPRARAAMEEAARLVLTRLG